MGAASASLNAHLTRYRPAGPIPSLSADPAPPGHHAAVFGALAGTPSAQPTTRAARPPAEPSRPAEDRPLLLVDIDGVVSLFGFAPHAAPEGAWHWIDGIPHFLSATAAPHLLVLADVYELVWCSGWEERANEYLPTLLGLPRALPFLRFGNDLGQAGAGDGPGDAGYAEDGQGNASHGPDGGAARKTRGHWKLAAIDAHVGARAVAWIDDCLDARCHAWAVGREAPTLLVQTDAAVGIAAEHEHALLRWAASIDIARPEADGDAGSRSIDRHTT